MKPIYLLLALVLFACQQEANTTGKKVEHISHDTMVVDGDTLTESIIVDTVIERKLNIITPSEKFLDKKFGPSYNDYLDEYYTLDTVLVLAYYDSLEWGIESGMLDDSCRWRRVYKNGITHESEYCREAAGVDGIIKFPYADKSDVVELVNLLEQKSLSGANNLIKHEWNADSTKISPYDSGAGCYLEINETPDTVIVQYHCGC